MCIRDRANSKTATYSIPENLSVTYAGDVVLSTDVYKRQHKFKIISTWNDTTHTSNCIDYINN